VSRSLGIWAKKEEVYLAVAEDGVLVDVDPQRVEAPSIMDEHERLDGFLASIRDAVADLTPDAVRILQPEQVYQAGYSEFAPRITLEALVRLACVQAGVPVEVLHRATARSRMGLPRGGSLDAAIDANLESVGRYWNAGRKYAAIAALASESK